MPQVSLQMLPKHRAYAAALQVINAAKMSSNEQNLFSLFFDTNIKLERSSSVVGNPGANFSAASHLGRCWRLLNDMFGDVDGWQKSKLEIKRIYKLLGEDGVSSCDEAIAFRKRIVAGGKQHLQSIYYEFIQQVVVQNRVQIGGMPTVHTYVDSFISLKFTKNGAWNSSVGMEISNGAATWAHMYYLLRCGLYSEALDYCANPAFERVADSRFFGWLTMFVKTGKLSAAGVAQIRDEWNSRIRPALAADSVPQNNGNVNARARVDPFKAAVYKILGRCELSSKIIKSTDVAPAVEDYLWLQLMLIDEDAAAGGPSARAVSPADRYTLRDMSVLMQKYGANHFSPQNRSPLVYFEVLLLCGEFERAVAFLYSSTAMGGSLPDLTTGTNTSALDAIHFAIALADSGVLRVPDNPRGFEAARSSDVLVTRVGEDGYEVACFLLPKVIHAYARLFFNRVDCVEAMHYLLVLGSVGTKLRDDDDDEVDGMDAIGEMVVSASAASGKDYTRIAHGYLRELLLACVKDSWACEALLGVSASTANIRVGGEIEKYMKLVYLSSFSDLVKRVLVPAAEEAVHKGRLEDAVKLFDYAQEYSTVVSILCKQLSEHFVTDSNAALQAQGSAGDSVGLFGLFNNQNSGFNKPSQVGMTGSGVSVMNASPAPKPSNSDASATEALVTASINRLEAYMSRPAIAQGIPDSARRTAAQLVALQTVVRNFAAAKYEDAVEAVKALRLVPTSAADMSLVLRSAEDFLALDANVAKCVPNLLVVAMEALVRVHMAYKEAARYGEAMRGAKLDEFKSIGRAVILYAGGIQYRIPSDVFARLNRLEVLMS
ncbi:hypothetical protein HDU83_001527 [Entophlyctis luteolus]|nr:hypothetical protein HDU83_001527 [Entophlyctis luteolus]